jgi:RimJ/RimL family protein N-acetyltransferase
MKNNLLDIPTRLETERLVLRSYQPGDGSWYYSVSQRNRDHLLPFESQNVVMGIGSDEEAETVVQELAGAWAAGQSFFLAALLKTTGEFVAQIYIGVANRDLPEFELGYFVDCDHEGRGYVTEAAGAALRFAFEHLKAHRVRLECDDTNLRSIRVAERCGMVREGHFRENKKGPHGEFTGTVHYGLLRDEFERRSHSFRR